MVHWATTSMNKIQKVLSWTNSGPTAMVRSGPTVLKGKWTFLVALALTILSSGRIDYLSDARRPWAIRVKDYQGRGYTLSQALKDCRRGQGRGLYIILFPLGSFLVGRFFCSGFFFFFYYLACGLL